MSVGDLSASTAAHMQGVGKMVAFKYGDEIGTEMFAGSFDASRHVEVLCDSQIGRREDPANHWGQLGGEEDPHLAACGHAELLFHLWGVSMSASNLVGTHAFTGFRKIGRGEGFPPSTAGAGLAINDHRLVNGDQTFSKERNQGQEDASGVTTRPSDELSPGKFLSVKLG